VLLNILADGDCDFARKLRMLILFNGGKPLVSVDVCVLGLLERGNVLKGLSFSCLSFTKLAISLEALLMGDWSAGRGGLVVILRGLFLLRGEVAPASGDVAWSSLGGLRTLLARREITGDELADAEVYISKIKESCTHITKST